MVSKEYIFLFVIFFLASSLDCVISDRHYTFVVKEASYTRLCETKKILTVNGKFPGPTLYARRGETVIVDVYNRGNENITIHWHGVLQPRNPWSDGPEYITQCPIRPGHKFRQKVILSEEEGTLWWHAHSDWSRATVHGPIIIYPQHGCTRYPFPKPHKEFPIILGEWWKENVTIVMENFLASGGQPVESDAYTINGQPGDLYNCSNNGTYKLRVISGRRYLLRIINAAMNEILFFGIANHNLTVVGTDASYTKPLTRPYIVITPGQTVDCILHANQPTNSRYYMAAKPYVSSPFIVFDDSITTAILQYTRNPSNSSVPSLPVLPDTNDTNAVVNFSRSVRSLANRNHPIDVPLEVSKRIFTTLSLNTFPCSNQTCEGPSNTTRYAASMTNISFVSPSIDILQAYYYHINGVFGKNFPDFPPLLFNFTGDMDFPSPYDTPMRGTEVKVLNYNASVEMILQGTSILDGIDHPMHIHGYSFYVMGEGLGNFNNVTDPPNFNLVDPPLRNTINVPINGWAVIRFRANNPGVWFMHCHFERHLSWGMNTVFIVKNGKCPEERIISPPPDMPPCK